MSSYRDIGQPNRIISPNRLSTTTIQTTSTRPTITNRVKSLNPFKLKTNRNNPTRPSTTTIQTTSTTPTMTNRVKSLNPFKLKTNRNNPIRHATTTTPTMTNRVKSLNPFKLKTNRNNPTRLSTTTIQTTSTTPTMTNRVKSLNPFKSKTMSSSQNRLPNPIKQTRLIKSNIEPNIEPNIEKNNKLLVISYNEGEEDFYQSDIINFWDNFKNISENPSEDPSVIIVCTQKSKSQVMIAVPGMKTVTGSNSTKHFPHVIGNFLNSKGYVSSEKLKKNASTMIRGISENNNVRTRIYIKRDNKFNIYEDEFIAKLSVKTVGQFSTMSVNRQAICYDINLNNKKIIIVNTELASYNNGDFGLSDRQEEFMGLIKEFKLHEKYNNGYNIIFCGSLNFKLNPFKMINNDNKSIIYKELKNKILKKYNINTYKKDLLKYNELKVYVENLIRKINNNNNLNIIKNIIGNKYDEIKNNQILYRVLLNKFLDSINEIGINLTCDYNLTPKNYRVYHPLKLGSVGKNLVESFDSGHSKYKESNTTKTGVVKGFVSGMYTGTKSVASSLVKPIKKYTEEDFEANQEKGFKIPSMCDRILFALQEDDIKYEYFSVYNSLKTSKNRIIYSVFNY
jgi:hypothetical protein